MKISKTLVNIMVVCQFYKNIVIVKVSQIFVFLKYSYNTILYRENMFQKFNDREFTECMYI